MLTIFGSIAVAIMFLSYWMEPRSKWFILIFAAASAATSVYSGLAEVYPIMVIEALVVRGGPSALQSNTSGL